jgi:hypothetical protein
MNDDQLIKSLINFLLPIIFLYGMYFLADLFKDAGFFALVYYAVLMVNGIMIYDISNNGKYKNTAYIDIICFTFALISIIYLIVIISLISDFFSI